MILAIDPGSEKCGIALVENSGKIIEHKIVPRSDILDLIRKQSNHKIIMGNSASGKEIIKSLSNIEIELISEKNSTLEARKLYWQENQPKGIWKFIPESLRIISEPIDNYAAIILAKRYLNL